MTLAALGLESELGCDPSSGHAAKVQLNQSLIEPSSLIVHTKPSLRLRFSDNGLIQPFVNYNFKEGFFLVSSSIATVNWKADSGQRR